MPRYKELIDIGQSDQEIANALLPRQATVLRSDGLTVWVKFVGEGSTSPGTKLPTTVAGLPTGAVGWVYPLAGGKGLFVATCIALPIPFAVSGGGGPSNTTSITTMNYVNASPASIVVPPGTYKVDAIASLPLRRSVATGEMWGTVRVDGVTPTGDFLVGPAFVGAGSTQFFSLNVAMVGVPFTTIDGVVSLEFGFRGANTAGTTTLYRAAMQGTLTRIG